jgi:hypothetical protein
MIDTASILAALRSLADDPLFTRIEILDLTRNLIKARLYLREDLFIQVYHNDRSRVTNLLIVLEGQRVFARDQIRGVWHRHPFENPAEHDTGPEGQRAITFLEFVEEAHQLLVEAKLL